MFSNQKVFLDVKDYGRIEQLEAEISQLGGTVEKFLSKEVTCVISNRTRTENASLHKDAFKPVSPECQTLRPSASVGRVMSRGQSILLRSNSLKDTPVCYPVAFAQTWGIRIVSLDTVVQAIDRHMQTCSPSSPVAKQPTESHLIRKRRKFLSPVVKDDKERHSKSFLTKFSGAFVKFEDTESNFRPFFKQYSTFPHIDLEGDLSNGIFKCTGNIRPVAVSKNTATAVTTRKQVWSKRGYCECCDVMYDDLNQHLVSADHVHFSNHADHFADLDKLIDEINFSAENSLLLQAEDNCTCHIASEKVLTECSYCRNPSTVTVESACHDVHSQENQTCECRSIPEESNKVVNVVENCVESQTLSVEQRDKSCSPIHSTRSVNSDRNCDDAVAKVSKVLNVQSLPDHCDVVNLLPTGSQSVDASKAAEAHCKRKSDDTIADENSSHSDDEMPEFISSDCVTSLLEIISNENSLHSPLPAEESRCNMPKSAALPCMPAASNYDTADTEVRLNEKELRHQTTVMTATDECHRFNAAVTLEQPFANIDIPVIKSEPASISTNATNPSEASLVTCNARNYSDVTSCNVKYEIDSSALPLFVVQDELVLPAVDQPDTCAATVTKSVGPVYACSQVNSSHLFDDYVFSPAISSGLMADTFDLHDKLLTMSYEQDAEQQSCSSAEASYLYSGDCADVSTSEMTDFYSQMESSPMWCFSEGLSPLADRADNYPSTLIHSCGESFERLAISAADNTATEFTPLCHSSTLCGAGTCSTSFAGSTDLNGNIQCSVPGFQTNAEANVVSEVNMCLGQEKGDSCLSHTSDCQMTIEDKAQLEVGLLDDDLSCNVLDLRVSTCSTLPVQSEATTESSALKHHPCDISAQNEDEPDVDNDSASTVVYSLHRTAEEVNDGESDTTVDHMELCVSSANSSYSTWKVSSFIDCRMRLVRTQAQSAESGNEASSKPCVLQPESCSASKSVEQTAMDSDSVSDLAYTSTCPTASVNGRIKDKSDVVGEPSMSGTDSAWEVISFVDSRMRLVRS